jgi:hypothetical protein
MRKAPKQKMLKQLLAITGLLALTAAGHVVYAAPTTLLCDVADQGFGYADGPAVVALDEQAGTVTVRATAIHLRNPGGVSGGYDGRGGSGPYTVGPIAATFAADTITFLADKSYGAGKECWSIDRLTGSLRGYASDKCTGQNRDVWAWRMWACHPAKAQF